MFGTIDFTGAATSDERRQTPVAEDGAGSEAGSGINGSMSGAERRKGIRKRCALRRARGARPTGMLIHRRAPRVFSRSRGDEPVRDFSLDRRHGASS